MAVAVVCLGLFGWYEFEATRNQDRLSEILDDRIRDTATKDLPPEEGSAEAAPSLPSDVPEETGNTTRDETSSLEGLVGRLEIERIGLEVMVLTGVDPATLRQAPGWIPQTSPPDEAGNVAIAGHRDTHFRPLRLVREGDTIRLTTPKGSYRYEVEWTRVVQPEQTEVLAPTPHRALTLVTCYPFFYVGSAPERFIVRAREQAPRGQTPIRHNH